MSDIGVKNFRDRRKRVKEFVKITGIDNTNKKTESLEDWKLELR